MHPRPPHLVTSRSVVRLPAPDDVPAVARYYRENREHLQPWEPARAESFFTEAEWSRRVNDARASFEADRAVSMFLFDGADRALVQGALNFTAIARGPAQMCHCGFSVARGEQGRGLMREALAAAIGYLFSEMNLHRIQASYLPRNDRSARLLARLGFRVEGRAEAYLLIDGRWEDHVVTSLVNPGWRAAQA